MNPKTEWPTLSWSYLRSLHLYRKLKGILYTQVTMEFQVSGLLPKGKFHLWKIKNHTGAGGVSKGSATGAQISHLQLMTPFCVFWPASSSSVCAHRFFFFSFGFSGSDMWHLSSLARDQTCNPCIGGTES